MIDGEHLMARTEVENLSFSAMPAATAAEHFSAFEPADKHLLIRLGNIKALTVHLLVRNYNFLVQTVYNGMAGIYNPKDFLLAVLTPLQFPGIRSAQLPEDFRGMAGMKDDKAHSFQNTIVNAIHNLIRHFLMSM